MHLGKLRIMNLSHSTYLTKSPNFTGVLNLERLILEGYTDWTAIRQLPSSIGRLKELDILTLKGCKGISSNSMTSELAAALLGLESLRTLDLSYCNLKSIPTAICSIYSLVFLFLNGNNMECLPTSINQLSRLSGLRLDGCKKLQELLQISPKIFQRNFRAMGSPWDIVLPGREIPKWFSHQSRGCSTSFQLPPHWFNNSFLGFAYAAVGFKEAKSDYCHIKMNFKCHITQRIVEECCNHIPFVKFGHMVVRCIPRCAFSGITEDDIEQLNEGGFECEAYIHELIQLSSIRGEENLGEKVYMPVSKVEIEKVGVHVVHREVEEQALSSSSSATTSKRKHDHDLNDNYYDAAAAGLSGSPRINDQEDHLNNLNRERLSG
ncbi:unnamed protein product [Camellia sinensis]